MLVCPLDLVRLAVFQNRLFREKVSVLCVVHTRGSV
jgi:hypothetical protein